MAEPASKSTALWVIKRLRRGGYQSLLAGGCVRDMLLGRRCYDYDVATDASPQQVKKLFGHVLLIGAKFGVAMVIHRGRKVEVTTFRSDLSYSDGRRPDGVKFTTPRQDAQRRDFTINGMFYDPIDERVVDYVSGREDLDHGIVRCIGKPQQRLNEDYLRMIRAVRFAVRLGFTIEPRTAAAIKRNAPRVAEMSGERICDELTKMLSEPSAPEALELLEQLQLAEWVLPELVSQKDLDQKLWQRGLARVRAVARRGRLTTTLGALLGELPSATIRQMVRRWGASNELRDAICFLADNLASWREGAEMALCDFKRLMASKHFEELLALWQVQERLETAGRSAALRARRRANGIDPARINPSPLVTGTDLKEIGLATGPLFGKILRTVRNAQLNEELSTRHAAMAMARKLATS